MYIWLFSRSDGAGRATLRKTRGLTRSVIALIVPPLPAASRPSKTTMTRRPFSFTHSCSAHILPCDLAISVSYCLRLGGLVWLVFGAVVLPRLLGGATRALELG